MFQVSVITITAVTVVRTWWEKSLQDDPVFEFFLFFSFSSARAEAAYLTQVRSSYKDFN